MNVNSSGRGPLGHYPGRCCSRQMRARQIGERKHTRSRAHVRSVIYHPHQVRDIIRRIVQVQHGTAFKSPLVAIRHGRLGQREEITEEDRFPAEL